MVDMATHTASKMGVGDLVRPRPRPESCGGPDHTAGPRAAAVNTGDILGISRCRKPNYLFTGVHQYHLNYFYAHAGTNYF
jgi:hypothetical protein